MSRPTCFRLPTPLVAMRDRGMARLISGSAVHGLDALPCFPCRRGRQTETTDAD